MKKVFITVFIFVFFAAALSAAVAYESARFAAMDIDKGVRGVAMSGLVAVADDASSFYWNPAGLSHLSLVEFSGAYDKWFLDSSFQYLNIGLPVGYGAIAGGFSYTDFGIFEKRNASGIATGSEIKPYNIGGGIAYGAPITEFLSAGIGVRFASVNVDTFSAFGALLDIGLMSSNIAKMFSVGVNFQGIDLTSGDMMPGNIRGGIGISPLKSDSLKLTGVFDAKYTPVYKTLGFGGGVEFLIAKIISLRGGYTVRNNAAAVGGGIAGLSAGLGLNLDKLTFDYALTSQGDLGMTHLVGVKFYYESDEEREKRNYDKLNRFLAEQNFRDGQDNFDNGQYEDALKKWREVKKSYPDYDGIDMAIAKAKKKKAGAGSLKQAENIFNEGMTAYENSKYDVAVKKWEEVKKLAPDYKEINVWLDDARELRASKGITKEAEKYFREGLKKYNDCDYNGAIDAWEKGLEKDSNNRKINQYIERTLKKQKEINEGIKKAKEDVAKDSTMIDGIKRLRGISNVCPAYKDAGDILSTLKDLIDTKARDYYYKGIEKYTEGNLDAAIVYWKNIEELDPKSTYVTKVKRYIEDAKSKQKIIQQKKKK